MLQPRQTLIKVIYHISVNAIHSNEAPSDVNTTLDERCFVVASVIFFLPTKTGLANSGTSGGTYKVMEPHCLIRTQYK